jgi:hypothetical protein
MRDVIPGEPLKSLLTRYYKALGVVDLLTIRLESHERGTTDIHRRIALFGMRVIDWRTSQFFKVPREQRHLVFYNLFWCGLQFDEPLATSFVHLKIDEMKVASAPEAPASFMETYRHAFLDPPYPLSIDREAAERLFVDLNAALFDDLNQWTIRRWANDWSSYFDAGNEWWGAFLWTLVGPTGRDAIWIGASSTD